MTYTFKKTKITIEAITATTTTTNPKTYSTIDLVMQWEKDKK